MSSLEKIVKFRGARADIEAFLRSLEYYPQFSILGQDRDEVAEDDETEGAFGNVNLIEMTVHFGVALGAHASWDLLKSLFENFRKGRRSLEVIDEKPLGGEKESEATEIDESEPED